MTICIAVKVNECLVFASDSATSIDAVEQKDMNGDPVQQVYRHGHKVFQLHRTEPIMAMTCGIAFIGQKSISMLSKEFRQYICGSNSPLDHDYKLEEVVDLARQYFLVDAVDSAYDKPSDFLGVFELYIGGYDRNGQFPKLWKLQAIDGKISKPICIFDETDCGVAYGGQPDPVSRLINGYGYKLEEILTTNNITQKSHPQLFKDIPGGLYLPLVHHIMPVKDAIDLAEFLADLTKKVFRFRAVQEYVSGDIDIAVVTRFEKFKWIKRKHFYKPELNRETNHD